MLNRIATVKDDGTVVMDIQSSPETTPLGVEGDDGNGDVLESLDEADIPYRPPIQIVMLIAGTHGDVEIFVVIGLRLQVRLNYANSLMLLCVPFSVLYSHLMYVCLL